MKLIITAFCLTAATTMTVSVDECQARNHVQGVESDSVQEKTGNPGQVRLTANANQTSSSVDFLNESTWYLGLKGTVLPQAGLGIDKVVANSPADLAGLAAGMVIISCNDIMITEEADVLRAMNTSGGILMVIVQLEDGSEGQTVVEMVQVSSISL